ncbi:MAG: NUDIX hydrolase [Woeseiaceae bacterium]|nr:NUDIX hydrolase [Woeseiaceae bacterium]
MYPTDLTVSAIVENEGRYLLVEESAMGQRVFNQPGGHIEAGESPEQAVVRETREETGCTVSCGELVGVYLWIHPQTRQQFLRIVYGSSFIDCDENARLDDGIYGRHWMTVAEIESRKHSLRSPVVLRCVHDYVQGKRQSDKLFTGMLPLEQNVDRILATADLV